MTAPRGRLSRQDEALALSVVRTKERKAGKNRRCGNCGLLYTQDEVNPEFDAEGRKIGYVCDGCY